MQANERYILEIRSGIVAIYDTAHPEYVDTPGCHWDYPWTVLYISGEYVDANDPRCQNGAGHWHVDDSKVEKMKQLVDFMNEIGVSYIKKR